MKMENPANVHFGGLLGSPHWTYRGSRNHFTATLQKYTVIQKHDTLNANRFLNSVTSGLLVNVQYNRH